MGILAPVCMASDGTRLYTFALGLKDSLFYHVLIKSSSIPSYTLNDMSWTLVSALGGTPSIPVSPVSIDSSCLVDETGVFTIVSPTINGTSTASKGIPQGLQYQPAGNASGGSGTWNHIYSPSVASTTRSTLFYLKDSSGKNTLMKAHINSGSYTGAQHVNNLASIGLYN
ncbi:hypothetical protein BGX26_006472, partial [Mortierella sp. AD094]